MGLQKADQLWFTSIADQEWMIQNWSIERSKCSSINFGVDHHQVPEPSDKKIAVNC